MQQKAAAKLDGSRIFLIGYQDAEMYRVQTGSNMHKQMPPVLLGRLVLTSAKLYFAYQRANMLSAILCMTGVMLMPLQVLAFSRLLSDRSVLFRNLKKRADEFFQEEGGSNKLTMKTVNEKKKSNSLGRKERSLVNSWSKHFADHPSLKSYSTVRDIFSRPFLTLIFWLLAGNCAIFALESEGVLFRAPIVDSTVLPATVAVPGTPWQLVRGPAAAVVAGFDKIEEAQQTSHGVDLHVPPQFSTMRSEVFPAPSPPSRLNAPPAADEFSVLIM